MNNDAPVMLWGSLIGAVTWLDDREIGVFQYSPDFLGSGIELANRILEERAGLGGVFSCEDDREAVTDILRVGTSAGGARAKAILAWNPKTNEFRSGQLDVGPGFEHWLMKFDGVSSSWDAEMASPLGYGKIEYAYHLMAVEAGIEMATCCLHEEGGRSHFMTKRFDRTARGGKLHMQSLGAMAHLDYKQPASHSYEQAIQVIQRLGLPRKDMDQQVLTCLLQRRGSQLRRSCQEHRLSHESTRRMVPRARLRRIVRLESHR
jgi:hypothetical protein